jgi:hypothetical protein
MAAEKNIASICFRQETNPQKNQGIPKHLRNIRQNPEKS